MGEPWFTHYIADLVSDLAAVQFLPKNYQTDDSATQKNIRRRFRRTRRAPCQNVDQLNVTFAGGKTAVVNQPPARSDSRRAECWSSESNRVDGAESRAAHQATRIINQFIRQAGCERIRIQLSACRVVQIQCPVE